MKLGLALVRAVVGLLFVGHGTQKLFGWFGGHGPEGTGQFMGSLGLHPGKRNALAAGGAEAAGGALIASGLLTPLGAAMITGTMTTAIRKVHAPHGPWVTDNGYEYNLVLIALVTALADVGPGDWSLDAALDLDLSGPAWALSALAAGVAGSAVVIAAGRRAGEDAEPPAPAAVEPPAPAAAAAQPAPGAD